jgi:hypothetical protein
VNPGHMEPVTPGENCLRGVGLPARNARKTHCKRGHSLDEANIYRNVDGARVCRVCHKQTVKAYLARCAARKAVLA